MNFEISNLNNYLNKKRKNYENLTKEKNEATEENKFFYNDYNNFLIKFFHFNSEINSDFSNNGIKTFSFGLGEDLELNEINKKYNNNHFYYNPSNDKNQILQKNNSDFKTIGIVSLNIS